MKYPRKKLFHQAPVMSVQKSMDRVGEEGYSRSKVPQFVAPPERQPVAPAAPTQVTIKEPVIEPF